MISQPLAKIVHEVEFPNLTSFLACHCSWISRKIIRIWVRDEFELVYELFKDEIQSLTELFNLIKLKVEGLDLIEFMSVTSLHKNGYLKSDFQIREDFLIFLM